MGIFDVILAVTHTSGYYLVNVKAVGWPSVRMYFDTYSGRRYGLICATCNLWRRSAVQVPVLMPVVDTHARCRVSANVPLCWPVHLNVKAVVRPYGLICAICNRWRRSAVQFPVLMPVVDTHAKCRVSANMPPCCILEYPTGNLSVP